MRRKKKRRKAGWSGAEIKGFQAESYGRTNSYLVTKLRVSEEPFQLQSAVRWPAVVPENLSLKHANVEVHRKRC